MEETHVKHKDTIPQLDLSSITVKQPSASFIQKDASQSMIAAQQQLPFSPPQQKKPRPEQGTGSKAGEPPAHKRPVKEEASSESV